MSGGRAVVAVRASPAEATAVPVGVRVFLVDDHEVVRRGLREFIETAPDLTVVGEAASADEALRLLPGANPDVAVLDVLMPPGGNGIELCRELRARHDGLIILMLSGVEDEEMVLAAVMAGASGFVLKQLRGQELLDTIRRVATGESVFDPGVAERLAQRARSDRGDDLLNRLTPQEQRILVLIAEGMTNRQIADTIFLSEKTVKNYVSNLLGKLGMKRRTEAAVYATRRAQR